MKGSLIWGCRLYGDYTHASGKMYLLAIKTVVFMELYMIWR